MQIKRIRKLSESPTVEAIPVPIVPAGNFVACIAVYGICMGSLLAIATPTASSPGAPIRVGIFWQQTPSIRRYRRTPGNLR